MEKTNRQTKEIKKGLRNKSIKELKEIIINLTPKDKCTKKDILQRDGDVCVFCGDNEDLQLHHIKPKILSGKNNSNNLIILCNYCHWYIHNNPKFKIHHSKLVKASIMKLGGKTLSYKGNTWGRKSLPIETKDNILRLHKEGLSMRNIAGKLKVSVGYAHKIINSEKQDE